MRNMAHYQDHNPGLNRFITGVLAVGFIVCMGLYLAGLYLSYGGLK